MNFMDTVQMWMRAGYDQNQATSLALGLPADGPPKPAPAAPAPPKPKKPPVQKQTTQASAGQGVRQARGSKKKTTLADLRISRPRVNTQLAIGAGGTGLNIGGY